MVFLACTRFLCLENHVNPLSKTHRTTKQHSTALTAVGGHGAAHPEPSQSQCTTVFLSALRTPCSNQRLKNPGRVLLLCKGDAGLEVGAPFVLTNRRALC